MKTWIVGVGASAGGLEAITQLVHALSPSLPCAYVVLQHLSPSYRSMMVDILARETSLKVKEAQQGDEPEAGTIYVVPPNANAVLKEGRIQLFTPPPDVVPKPSINQFFLSLAAEEGESAIGILLSGTGSDGVAGLRAIQAAGGYTLVQEPRTAKYDGMPRAAIDAGVASYVLAPEEMGARLEQITGSEVEMVDETHPPDLLQTLLIQLRDRCHHDFQGYKSSTLMRRVRRRIIATGCQDLPSYLTYVEAHPDELDRLSRDILISVTAFFRDREAFEALREVVGEIVHRKPPGSEIRIWVAGCATGEEAYSIAMFFADALGEQLPRYRVQIFATDIDEEALNTARRGFYPTNSLEEVPAPFLERYFQPQKGGYEVSKVVRDLVVFAKHNLVYDPPFLRLDLISCRNVLIYFDASLQAKVLRTFHFALLKEGYLFLGRSESVAQAEQLFVPTNRRERIFRKQGETSEIEPPVGPLQLKVPVPRRERRMESLLAALVAHFGLAAVLTDREGQLLYSAGEVGRYLQFPSGAAELVLVDAVVPSLRGELLALMHRCRQTGKPQRGRRRKLQKGYVRLFVGLAPEGVGENFYVLFVPETEPTTARQESADNESQVGSSSELEDELVTTREHLQTLIEELATANEEMQALNEEAQASNEELQATNEELEAANEELQATNEELVTLNEELNVKTQELANLAQEYANLYDALQFPILVFDQELRLIRFNAPAMRRFDLRQTAIGQHVSRLRLLEGMVDLEQALGRVLSHADREEHTLESEERTLRLSITPGFDEAGALKQLVVALWDITEVVRAKAQVSEYQARLTALMENTSVLFVLRDLQGRILYVNQRFRTFFGLEEGNLEGQTLFDLLPHALAAELWRADVEALSQKGAVETTHTLTRETEKRWLHCVHQVICDQAGRPNALLLQGEDVTQMRLAEEQMRITARVFDQAGEAIMITDPDGTIQTVNSAFTQITGYSAREAIGRKPSLLRSGRHSADFYRRMWQSLKESGFWQGEIWNRRKSGEIYPEWLTITKVVDEQGAVEHYVAVFSDISQMKESQRKAEYLATHDPLTGLPNRALFNDRLRHALAQARRQKQRVALLFIDLDNFKTINDTLGHEFGDELLREVATRLRQAVRDIDTVARLGGDEFTVILHNCAPDQAQLIGQRIVDELAASYPIHDHYLYVSASVGVAFYPEDGGDSSSLIRAADAAMYRAKELGRNRLEFFKPELQVKLMKRAAIEAGLRQAIDNRRLRLVLQPKYRLGSEPILAGAEALLRWSDPDLGEVSPGEFIPVAEACGLIGPLTQVVESLVVELFTHWRDGGLQAVPVAFNLSPQVLREPDFAARLKTKLAAGQIPPSLITVEITEGALVENSTTVCQNLEALHRLGVKVAIDDFGTGYSSLAYLKHLPLAELKIDKRFVDGLGKDPEDEAIARAILGLAQALSLHTVAEGVETVEQLAWLQNHGCHFVQGYLLAPPMELEVFEDLLAKERDHGGKISG